MLTQAAACFLGCVHVLHGVLQEVKREADWFRIGFEPLFVDLSKLGCFYLVFLLVKVSQSLLFGRNVRRHNYSASGLRFSPDASLE